MLVLFAVGMGSIGWMLALGVVIALQKNVSWGRELTTPFGATLIGAGLTLALWQAQSL